MSEAEERLAELLARVDGHLEEIDAEPPAADELVLVAAVCSAPDAPGSLRRLAGLVSSGQTTWEAIWRDPLAHGQAGLDLLGAVMRASMR